jgi:hypothetical protein
MTQRASEAPTEPTDVRMLDGMEYIPTPTVFPRMILIALKVPSFSAEEGGERWGVRGSRCAVGENSVVLEEVSSS